MTNWELARYLIDAKKCVDNILFIAENVHSLKNLALSEIIDEKQRKFYINVKVVYDKTINKQNQKLLMKTDQIFALTCRERNKNFAHKDDDYISPDYNSIFEIANIMKERLIHCFEVCKESLPNVITLDFIDYDRDLYRFINKIDNEREEELLKAQYPLYDFSPNAENNKGCITKKVFHDTEDFKKIEDPNEYAVLMKSGLTVREGIQEMQDSCIKINVLMNKNMWATPNMKVIDEMKRMIEQFPKLPFLY